LVETIGTIAYNADISL